MEIAAILRCDLERPLPETTARVPLATFVASRAEALDEVADIRLPLDPESRELIERRLDRGFLCFVGRVEGRLVAFNWTQYEPGEDDGSYVALEPDEVHCLDAYTVPEFRGQNLHAALLREMLLFNAGLGYRRAYSKIFLTNRRSPKAHRRLGWERTGTALLPRGRPGLPVVRLAGDTHPWRRLRSSDVR
jgi:GNAT superfamily N-acetyltransferase